MAVSSRLLIYLFPILTLLTSSCAFAEMVETACDVGKNYADISVTEASSVGDYDAKSYSISFDNGSIAMRFPPMYYALRYVGIESVVFEASHKSDDAGRLSLHVHGFLGMETKHIGIVQRSCWEATKQFIIRSKVKVKISEPSGAPG